ncbi:hypothetical protein [Leptospira sarikeiensis]|uniref:Uncharacterized protein n=1 Tax=Leptospira sarikeiensis TaxID=2484943 RepID=A0A4R9K4Q6_9LEPT|nr:hypothetical protein [Leptospira sarikeiensis]TGL59237.1 hypothetical protein EHQ64_16255 [Leptospira sarikeiensis]
MSPKKDIQSIKNLSLLDDVVVDENTFQDALRILGDVYHTRLTFDPPLKRSYRGTEYSIKYILSYEYVTKETGYIGIRLFFNTDEKLVIRDIGSSEYPKGTKYNNNPEAYGKTSSYDCDLKYYERVSNPVFLTWGRADSALWKECEWEKDYPEHRTIEKMKEDKKKRDEESARQRAEFEEKKRQKCLKDPKDIGCPGWVPNGKN